jgi:hypothetical protein
MRKSRNEHKSAGLPPIADMKEPFRHFAFVPEAAVSRCSKVVQKLDLFDDLVGAGEQRRGHVEAERLGGLEIDHQLVFHRRLHR